MADLIEASQVRVAVTADSAAAGLANTPKDTSGVMGSFEPRKADHLQSIVDVLENMPPAKPTGGSLVVQLAGPGLLAAKSAYDFWVAMAQLLAHQAAPNSPTPDNTKPLVLLLLSIAFVVVSVWVAASMITTYRSALKKTDPHHERVLRRARPQLAQMKRDARELLDEDDRKALQSIVEAP